MSGLQDAAAADWKKSIKDAKVLIELKCHRRKRRRILEG